MITAIGANIFGFIAGVAVFALHAILIGISKPPAIAREVTLPEAIEYLFVGSLGTILILAVLFWLSSVLVVYPAYLILRKIAPPALLVSGLSAFLAVMPVYLFLESPGVGSSLGLAWYSACLCSSLVTGAVTGYMLVHLMKTKENKSHHQTTSRRCV
jgi:hypothetical protein